MRRRAIQVVPPMVEAAILNYHGDTEKILADGPKDYQRPVIGRREVERELSFDLIEAAMRGVV